MPGRRRGIQLATVCALATVVHLLPMNDVQSCSVQGRVVWGVCNGAVTVSLPGSVCSLLFTLC